MTLYRLDGEITNSWNALVRAVNEACDADLPELTDPARWAKSDIEAVQEALAEAGICEFSEIGARWSQAKIDELVEAVQEGDCCCEEVDKGDFPDLDWPEGTWTFSTSDSGAYWRAEWATANDSISYNYMIFDWAGWVMQAAEALVVDEVECPDEETIEKRSHGRGWVGRQYEAWEMWFAGVKIREGSVVAGYIDVGEGDWQAAETCEEPDGGAGTPLGTDDPAWGFPYTFSFDDPAPTIVGVNHQVDGLIGDLSTSDLDAGLGAAGAVNNAYATSPFIGVWERHTEIPDNEKPFLRLICEVEDA